MRIVLSESLSRHFTELRFSEHPNVDRLMDLRWEYDHQRGDIEWSKLRCAAKLVADEIVLLRPDYNQIAKVPGSDAIRWLEDGILGRMGDKPPNPSLMVDGEGRVRFLSERLEAQRRSEPWLWTSAASDYDAISKRVEDFVNQLISPVRDPLKPALLLSPDPIFNRVYLELGSSVTADNILATLATAGIKIVMPCVSVETGNTLDINYVIEDETIQEVRHKFGAEREAYVDCLRKFIKHCYEGLRGGLYEDVFDYADKASNQEIMVQVKGFEAAVRGADKKLLDRIKVGLIEGLPSIVEALVDPKKSFVAQAGIELMRVLSGSFAQHTAYREAYEKFPLASYAFRLRSSALMSGGP